eukprot:2353179-Prymnesium_polylepis.1
MNTLVGRLWMFFCDILRTSMRQPGGTVGIRITKPVTGPNTAGFDSCCCASAAGSSLSLTRAGSLSLTRTGSSLSLTCTGSSLSS